jgi:hypothetical protein
MSTDGPIVDEVRRRAMEISAEFNHDVHKYAEYLRRRQQEPGFRDHIVAQITVVPVEGKLTGNKAATVRDK